MPAAQQEDEEDQDADIDHGLTAAQRRQIQQQLQQWNLVERSAMLVGLQYFLTLIVQEIATMTLDPPPLAQPTKRVLTGSAAASTARPSSAPLPIPEHVPEDTDDEEISSATETLDSREDVPDHDFEDPDDEANLLQVHLVASDPEDHLLALREETVFMQVPRGNPVLEPVSPGTGIGSSFMFFLDAMAAALRELPQLDQAVVVPTMRERLDAVDGSCTHQEMVLLRALFTVDAPHNSTPMTAGARRGCTGTPLATAWVNHWWPILLKHLPAELRPGNERAAGPKRPRVVDTAEPSLEGRATAAAQRQVDVAVQTTPEVPHEADVLLTATTATQQQCARLPTLRLQPGQSVVFTILAAPRDPGPEASADPAASSTDATAGPAMVFPEVQLTVQTSTGPGGALPGAVPHLPAAQLAAQPPDHAHDHGLPAAAPDVLAVHATNVDAPLLGDLASSFVELPEPAEPTQANVTDEASGCS